MTITKLCLIAIFVWGSLLFNQLATQANILPEKEVLSVRRDSGEWIPLSPFSTSHGPPAVEIDHSSIRPVVLANGITVPKLYHLSWRTGSLMNVWRTDANNARRSYEETVIHRSQSIGLLDLSRKQINTQYSGKYNPSSTEDISLKAETRDWITFNHSEIEILSNYIDKNSDQFQYRKPYIITPQDAYEQNFILVSQTKDRRHQLSIPLPDNLGVEIDLSSIKSILSTDGKTPIVNMYQLSWRNINTQKVMEINSQGHEVEKYRTYHFQTIGLIDLRKKQIKIQYGSDYDPKKKSDLYLWQLNWRWNPSDPTFSILADYFSKNRNDLQLQEPYILQEGDLESSH